MRKIVLAISLSLITPQVSFANCEGDTCIDVTADEKTNEVVITVKKGKPGSTNSTKPKPRPTATTRKLWIPWLPKPQTEYKPKVRTSVKPRAKSRVRTIAGSQISNQVKRLLPAGSIITQPLVDPLIHEPVNFLTNTPTSFTTVIIVLDVPITIHLTPVFKWDFGDGGSLTTKLPGAPYPLNLIENTYKTVGEKQVTLTTTWNGYWRAGTITAPIKGAIAQSTSKRVFVRPAAITYKP